MILFIAIFSTILHLRIITISAHLSGTKESCEIEGEPIVLDAPHLQCYNCTCHAGQVQCARHQCSDLEGCYLLETTTQDKECCRRCQGCMANGLHYQSGDMWTEPESPCQTFTCLAGVITRSTVQCYVPCDDPTPPKIGECCPECPGYCSNNNTSSVFAGTNALTKSNPCISCKCVESNLLSCAKIFCPVLNCPTSNVVYDFEQCCPRCRDSAKRTSPPRGACLLGNVVYPSGKQFVLDECTNCTCDNSTLTCERINCPVLKCDKNEQKIGVGQCCATCQSDDENDSDDHREQDDDNPSANLDIDDQSGCVYNNETYKNGETWNTEACETCVCKSGQISCSPIMCPSVNCPTNSILKVSPGQCCPSCVESQGICTIFGGSHYRTFDDKLYAFVGSCKYQLSSSKEFSVRVKLLSSGNDVKIKRIFMKVSNARIDLQYTKNIRVDDRSVKLPYSWPNKLDISDTRDSVIVNTAIGVKIKWNYEGFLELAIPWNFRDKVVGLCGNFDSQADDDLTTREGILVENPAVFAQSWTVGDDDCLDTREYEVRACDSPRNQRLCGYVKGAAFRRCSQTINVTSYYETCLRDVCQCSANDRQCHCESFETYARDCRRLGINLPRWRKSVGC